jgi:hypothetical protein
LKGKEILEKEKKNLVTVTTAMALILIATVREAEMMSVITGIKERGITTITLTPTGVVLIILVRTAVARMRKLTAATTTATTTTTTATTTVTIVTITTNANPTATDPTATEAPREELLLTLPRLLLLFNKSTILNKFYPSQPSLPKTPASNNDSNDPKSRVRKVN